MSSSWVCAPELSDQAPGCVGCGLSKMAGARRGEGGEGQGLGRDILGLPCLPEAETHWDSGHMASGSTYPFSG